jgi:hypothetical protein
LIIVVRLSFSFLETRAKPYPGRSTRCQSLLIRKEVKQTGFPGGGGNLGESVSAGEHIDKRGLAHIGTADEGEFGQFGRRAEFSLGKEPTKSAEVIFKPES